jgi:hypothetical protein
MLEYKDQVENEMKSYSIQETFRLKCRIPKTIHVCKVAKTCTKYFAKNILLTNMVSAPVYKLHTLKCF